MKFKGLYDAYIYSEDDMLISNRTFNSWLNDVDILWEKFFIRYFTRCEKGRDNLIDIKGKEKKTRKCRNFIVAGGRTYGQFTMSFAACWILNKNQFDFYCKNNFQANNIFKNKKLVMSKKYNPLRVDIRALAAQSPIVCLKLRKKFPSITKFALSTAVVKVNKKRMVTDCSLVEHLGC